MFSDPFTGTSLDGTKWDQLAYGSSSFSYDSGGVHAAVTGSSGDAILQSSATVNLTGDSAVIHWVTAPAGVVCDFYLAGLDDLLIFEVAGGTIGAGCAFAGFTWTAAYSATTHAWWRIRESGGTIYFDTSANGADWTNRTTKSVASFGSITALYVTFETAYNTATGTAVYRSFNTSEGGATVTKAGGAAGGGAAGGAKTVASLVKAGGAAAGGAASGAKAVLQPVKTKAGGAAAGGAALGGKSGTWNRAGAAGAAGAASGSRGGVISRIGAGAAGGAASGRRSGIWVRSGAAVAGASGAVTRVVVPAPHIIAEDPSTPAPTHRADGTSGSATSNSFAPPAGALVVVLVVWMWDMSGGGTISVQDSDGLAYAVRRENDYANNTSSAIFVRHYATSPGTITVTATCTSKLLAAVLLTPRVLTGAAADQSAAATAASASTGQAALVTTVAGSWAFVAGGYSATGTPAVNANTQSIDYWSDPISADVGAAGRMKNPTGTPGSITLGWTSNINEMVAAEIVPEPQNLTKTGGAAAGGAATGNRGGTRAVTGGAAAGGAGAGGKWTLIKRGGAAAGGAGAGTRLMIWAETGGAAADATGTGGKVAPVMGKAGVGVAEGAATGTRQVEITKAGGAAAGGAAGGAKYLPPLKRVGQNGAYTLSGTYAEAAVTPELHDVIVVFAEGHTPTELLISDTAGNTWEPGTDYANITGSSKHYRLFWCTDATAGATTIRVTGGSDGSQYMQIGVYRPRPGYVTEHDPATDADYASPAPVTQASVTSGLPQYDGELLIAGIAANTEGVSFYSPVAGVSEVVGTCGQANGDATACLAEGLDTPQAATECTVSGGGFSTTRAACVAGLRSYVLGIAKTGGAAAGTAGSGTSLQAVAYTKAGRAAAGTAASGARETGFAVLKDGGATASGAAAGVRGGDISKAGGAVAGAAATGTRGGDISKAGAAAAGGAAAGDRAVWHVKAGAAAASGVARGSKTAGKVVIKAGGAAPAGAARGAITGRVWCKTSGAAAGGAGGEALEPETGGEVLVADSLMIANLIELLGGPNGMVSALPQCTGATFRLAVSSSYSGGGFSQAADSFGLGAPQPQTDLIASLMIDGERPTGRRASNRTITLPVLIRAPDRATLAAAREVLLQMVDQDSWQLTWTRDGGLPLVFDCFRALPTIISYNPDLERRALVTRVLLTFPALPYGRSDERENLAFDTSSSVPGYTPPPAPVTLDDFSSVSSLTQPTWWQRTTAHVLNSYSAVWDWDDTDEDSGPFYTANLAAPADITGRTRLTFYLGLGSPQNYNRWHQGNVTFGFVLTDTLGHTISFGTQVECKATNSATVPAWTQVTAAIPQGAAGFDYTNVTRYSIHAWRFVDRDGDLELDADAYLNGLQAQAATALPAPPTSRGNVFSLLGIVGTARTPLTLQFAPPKPAVATTSQTFTTPGTTNWTVPNNVSSLKVRVQGAGGVGGGRTTAGLGGGGGGGATAGEDAYAVTSGQRIPVVIGAGGTATSYPTLIAAYVDREDSANRITLTTPSFAPSAGEVIVVKAANSGDWQTFSTPTASGLTFTSRVNRTTEDCRVAIWTTTVPPGGVGAITVSMAVGSDSESHSFVVERWGGAKLAASPATMSAGAWSGAPSGTCTTAVPYCVVSWVNADYYASQSARTYRDSPSEEAYVPVWDRYTAYYAYQQAASAGAQTCGLTAPSDQEWSMAGVEIQPLNVGALKDGEPSSFDGAIIAAGGKSVPADTATGGLGGATADCTGTIKYRGGNGYTATSGGGGGGSSAGTDVQGNDATSSTGASAPAGGGGGGNGGAAGGNNAGTAGSQPGGGGGGACSTGSTVAGGSGPAGKATVTYDTPPTAFKTLIGHIPGMNAPAALVPIIPVGDGVTAPDGREYTVPLGGGGVNARYDGTYTVVLVAYAWNTPASARNLTVTIKQYDYLGGPATTVTAGGGARTVTPSTDIVNGIVVMGEVTLPARDIAPDQTSAYYTIAVTSSNASDRFLDVVLLDVAGQTVMVNVPGTGYVSYWVDEPEVDQDLGRVLGSAFDRPQAVSVLDSVMAMSGGPLSAEPGDNTLVAYSADAGAPAVVASYYPRWWADRMS